MLSARYRRAAAINWLLALLIVALYAGMQWLDGPSDHQAMLDQAANTQDVINAAAAQAQADRVAQAEAQVHP